MLEHTISDQSNDQVPEQLNLQSYSYNDASQDHADLYDPEDPRAAEDGTNLQIVINSAVNELKEFEQESVKSIKFDVEYDAGDKVIKIDEETEETSSSWESVDEKESDGMDYIYMVIAILFIGGLVGIYLGCKKSSTNKVKENVDRKETIKLTEKTDLNDVNIKTDTKLYDSIKKQEKQVNKMESKVAELKVVKNEMKENKTEMKGNKTALKVTEKKRKDVKGKTEKNTLKAKKNEEQKNGSKKEGSKKKGSKKEESEKEGSKKEGSEKEGSKKEGKCQKAFKIWFGLFSVFTFCLGLAEIIHYVYTWNKGGSSSPSVFTPNAAVYVHGICSIITVIIFVIYIIKFGCPNKWQVLHMFFLALLSIAIFVVRLEMSWTGKWTTNKINTVAGIGEITLLVLYILFGIFGIIFVILECCNSCKRN